MIESKLHLEYHVNYIKNTILKSNGILSKVS